jgi:hypothetical protein
LRNLQNSFRKEIINREGLFGKSACRHFLLVLPIPSTPFPGRAHRLAAAYKTPEELPKQNPFITQTLTLCGQTLMRYKIRTAKGASKSKFNTFGPAL